MYLLDFISLYGNYIYYLYLFAISHFIFLYIINVYIIFLKFFSIYAKDVLYYQLFYIYTYTYTYTHTHM